MSIGLVVGRNHILATLSEPLREALVRALEPLTLADAQVLYEPAKGIETLYFPDTAVLSIIQVGEDGGSTEIGMVGCEGVTGLDAILCSKPSTARAMCQVPGMVFAISLRSFRNLMVEHKEFAQSVSYYVGGYCAMLAQLVACNRLHRVEQRGARWLLMTADRAGRLEFPMTQDRLGMMLGAQRPTVTTAMAVLRDAGCLESTRGRVQIRDRDLLRTFACECYLLCSGVFDRPHIATGSPLFPASRRLKPGETSRFG